MEDDVKRKALAVGKIAFGAVRMAGGITTGFGGGLIGSVLHAHGLTGAASTLARKSIVAGMDMLEDGVDELKKSK